MSIDSSVVSESPGAIDFLRINNGQLLDGRFEWGNDNSGSFLRFTFFDSDEIESIFTIREGNNIAVEIPCVLSPVAVNIPLVHNLDQIRDTQYGDRIDFIESFVQEQHGKMHLPDSHSI